MHSLPAAWFCVQYILFNKAVLGIPPHEDASCTTEEPLYLTQLLEDNKILEAQQKSRVNPDIGNTTSYSGYFTVNKACESNLYFWFFPAQKSWQKAPVLLWVQGGPGISSLSSLFQEMGPLTYTDKLGSREYSWNVENSLLFIDQPVGTGYSFTGKGCYAKNETDVGRDLYSAVVQFFQLFPELQSNKFFIAGHSYAGHFIPALGHTIHKNNPSAKVKINLSGFMIGNGWMDAFYQYDVGSYLYQLGLIDDKGRDVYYEEQNKMLQHLKNGEWEKAIQIRTELLVGDTYVKRVGNVSVFNYLLGNEELVLPYVNFIQSTKIRKALHVGSVNYTFENLVVGNNLGVDPVLSVKPWVEEILNNYFIVFYTGQLDIICGYPMTVNFLNALNWSGQESFKNATRHKWCVGKQQAGYYKGGHNLYDVMMRNAGHTVAYDQPHWSYVLINSVTSGTTDNPLHALNVC